MAVTQIILFKPIKALIPQNNLSRKVFKPDMN